MYKQNKNNVETSCGHKFCLSCIETGDKNSNKFKCPIFRKVNYKNKLKIINDKKLNYLKDKTNCIIVSNNLNTIKFYKTHNLEVKLISKRKVIDKPEIYFLENIDNVRDILIDKLLINNTSLIFFK